MSQEPGPTGRDEPNQSEAHGALVLEETSWVQCDRCTKWRRMPQSLADSLSEDQPWYCEMNPDSIYNSCSVPQELSDHEIDRGPDPEPEPVDEKPAAPSPDKKQKTTATNDKDQQQQPKRFGKLRKRPPVWQKMTDNVYLHRQRKQQDEDDIMICQCKHIWATDTTTIGCGEHCLNRMLNIECVPEYCPSGDRCTNRVFSKRQYAPLDVKRAGAKGFGLFTKNDLKAGDFIIEYVGEVLDEDEYARRREFYAGTGQRHYYFMNVGNGEVIDATRRGGLGRFINHSCEPNCETQKWVVRGELAIGLFALEDVAAGTELTFDYNFERYGDKPMKCLCGSKSCRGVIGGSQETVPASKMEAEKEENEAIVIEEEDIEPIMITEKDQDAAISAILDRAVGLGWESGWNAKMQKRLEKLAAKKGYDLSKVAAPSTAGGGKRGAAAAADDEDEGDDMEDEDAEAAAAAAAAHAYIADGGDKGRKSSAAKRPKAPKGKGRKKDPDWQDRQIAAAAAAFMEVVKPSPASAAATISKTQAEKATAAAVDDAAAASAGTSTKDAAAAHLKDRDRDDSQSIDYRDDRGGDREIQSPAPLSIPKRLPSMGAGRAYNSFGRRRSEVDRRLQALILPSGRLRECTTSTVVRVLRMFNLCDISPTVSRTEEETFAAEKAAALQLKTASSLKATGGATTPVAGSVSAGGPSTSAQQQQTADSAAAVAGGSVQGAANSREDGEVSPERPQSALGGGAPTTSGGMSLKANGGSRDRLSEEEDLSGSGTALKVRAPSPPGVELSPRQQARLADLSLLLDVILKTNALAAREEFVKCGVLRQLLGVVGRNTGGRYYIALRKILRVVESLPFTADDLHHTRSAHGSFADLLRYLTGHPDYEVRNRSWALLKKWPVGACTRPVDRPVFDGMVRGGGGGGPLGGGGGGGPLRGTPLSAAPLGGTGGRGGGGGRGGEFGGSPRPPPYMSPRDGGAPYSREPLPPSRFASGGGDRSGRSSAPYYSNTTGRGGGGDRSGPPPYASSGGRGWRPDYRGGGDLRDDRDRDRDRDRPPPYRSGGGGGEYRERDGFGGGGGGSWRGGRGGGGGYEGGGRYNDDRDNRDYYSRAAGGDRERESGPFGSIISTAAPPAPPPRGVGSSSVGGDGGGGGGRMSGRKRSRWDDDIPSSIDQQQPGYTGNGTTTNTEPLPPGFHQPMTTTTATNTTNVNTVENGMNGGGYATYDTHQYQQQQQQQVPPSLNAPGAAVPPMLSPMSDDGGPDEGEYNDGGNGGFEQNGGGGYDNRSNVFGANGGSSADTWDEPDAVFEAAVADIVRKRVGKYEQSDHPMCISRDAASEVFRKVRREVINKEQLAFEERKRMGQFKPIERGKLEVRIKEFVRDSVKRLHAAAAK